MRIFSLDYLKLILAYSVVIGHSGVIQNHLTTASFVLGNGIIRNAVPVFSIISGFFLYAAVQRGMGRRWLWRVLMLYALWMLIYAPVWLNYVGSIRDATSTMLWGYMHLWYVAGLLVAGIAVMLLLWLGRITGLGMRPLVVTAVLCALTGVAMEYLAIADVINVPLHRYRNGLFIVFPFAAAGYLIAQRVAERGLDSLPDVRILASLAILTQSLMLLEVYMIGRIFGVDNVNAPEIPLTAYLCSPAYFLLFLRLNLPRPVADFGFISAVVYFTHIYVMLWLRSAGVELDVAILLISAVLTTVLGLLVRQVMPGKKRQAKRAAQAHQPGPDELSPAD